MSPLIYGNTVPLFADLKLRQHTFDTVGSQVLTGHACHPDRKHRLSQFASEEVVDGIVGILMSVS